MLHTSFAAVPAASHRRSRASLAGAGLLVALVLAAPSCTSLPEQSANTCGNAVVESGEDCDGFAPPGSACRKKGEDLACHFDCKDSACPVGFTCSPTQKICNFPEGSWESDGTTFDTTAFRVAVGDFDGNRVMDVLSMSKPDEANRVSMRVLYFGGGSVVPTKSLSIKALGISPTVVDANLDAIDDVVFGSFGQGVNVLLGDSDQTLVPQAYARFPLPDDSIARLGTVNGANTLFHVLPILYAHVGGQDVITASNARDPIASRLADLPASPEKFAAVPVTGNFIEAASPCDEIVLAYQNGDLYLTEVCTPAGDPVKVPAKPQKIFSIPGSGSVTAMFAGDFDGDKHTDLVFNVGAVSHVAFGRGDGTFGGDLGGAGATQSSRLTCLDPTVPVPVPLPCQPIAFEADPHVGGVGRLVISASGVGRTTKIEHVADTTQVTYDAVVVNLGAGWTSAVVADLNRDGNVDVLAGSDDSLDLDFYNGTTEGVLNPSKIETTAPVGQITVGDYDGDLVLDAGVTLLGGGGGDIDEFAVLYGNLAGPPEPPFSLGTFQNIQQLISGRFEGQDTIDELGLIYHRSAGDQATVLIGGGDRELLSPFGLSALVDTSVISSSPVAIAFGQYDGDTDPDLAAIGWTINPDPTKFGSDPRFWWAPVLGNDARMTSTAPTPTLPQVQLFSLHEELPGDPFTFSGVLASGDLDGDGLDEVAGVTPTLGAAGAILTIFKPPAASTTIAPFALSTQLTLPVKFTPLPVSQLQVVDVDGDGKKDLVGLLIGRRQRSLLSVMFNDGHGGFSTDAVADLAPASDKEEITSFTTVPGFQATKIVVLTTETAYTVEQPKKRALELKPLAGMSGGLAIAAGDVTGDGVADLIVGEGQRARVHAGNPRTP